LSTYIIDKLRSTPDGQRRRVFYTGRSIDFSTRMSNAKVFTDLNRAKEALRYLMDCNMTVYIIEIKDNKKEDVVYSTDMEPHNQVKKF